MIFAIYDKNTYKCYFVEGQTIDNFELKPNEAIKEHNSDDLSQTDIRAYNKDSSVKSLEEQVQEKIIVLKDNEIIDDGVIRELNKNNEDDLVVLIERGLEQLENTKKIATDEEGKKYITEKTTEEKYSEGLITKEEYNEYIIQQRQGQYTQNLDGARAELLDDVLNSLAYQGLLNESQIEVLRTIENSRVNIKAQYKKIL